MTTPQSTKSNPINPTTAPFVFAYVRTSVRIPGAARAQLRQITAAAESVGLPVARVYADVGVSANAPDKPELERLLRDVSDARPRPRAVFVASATRVGRQPDEVRRAACALSAAGVALVIVDR